MSWDGYVDNIIAGSKDASGYQHIDKAAIVGLKDRSIWTSGHKDSLKVAVPEISAIVDAVSNNDCTAFQTSGVKVDGVKYQFLREDGDMIMAKKKDQGAISIRKTQQAVIIAHCPEGGQQGTCNKAVDNIGNYLVSTGY